MAKETKVGEFIRINSGRDNIPLEWKWKVVEVESHLAYAKVQRGGQIERVKLSEIQGF